MTAVRAGTVLDASAVLALVRAEPGAEVVAEAIGGAICSAVNWGEAAEKILAAGGDPAVVRARLEALGAELVQYDVAQAEETARLRQPTRLAGLSLGDRACLALGRLRGLPVLTADRAWDDLENLEVEVRLIR
jgi:ribonuclease VapC